MAGIQAARTLLATFVDISDIHIGEIDKTTGDASTSAAAARAYSNLPWLDGLLGHHGRALHELDDFVATLRAREPEARLLVTGDLSRFGGSDELLGARAFLEGEIDLSPALGNMAGLRLAGHIHAIPGNHDQWGGAAGPLSAWPSQYGGVFPTPLLRIDKVPLSNGRHIAFLCIDSDADIKAQSVPRLLAHGAFQSQLQSLQATIGPKPANEFRIMLIHHSWFQRQHTLRMTAASRAALEQFLVENEVSAMLCGHSHAPLMNDFTATGPLGTATVHELRSGSSAQHDSVPLKWKTMLQKRPARSWDPNSLIVHRVYDDPLAVRWHAELYARAPGGFKHVKQWNKQFALL
ncbi:metallophosphoesterase family protein [Massilia sp. TWR1-2-2]|uniref:metallophosphoesterase family protein n=1 Tax=Massilia sp. TWR1-2-2 TaxID=2804584 RepID=UPI003CEF5866